MSTLQDLVDGDRQVFSPARVAGALRTTKAEIADTLGLSRDALSRTARIRAPKTQTRLREMVEILRRVEDHTGSPPLVAYAWLRSEALPGIRRPDARPVGAPGEGGSGPCPSRSDHGRRGGLKTTDARCRSAGSSIARRGPRGRPGAGDPDHPRQRFRPLRWGVRPGIVRAADVQRPETDSVTAAPT